MECQKIVRNMPTIHTQLIRQNALTPEGWNDLKMVMGPQPSNAVLIDIDSGDTDSDAESPPPTQK
jgi:hypothetical protein